MAVTFDMAVAFSSVTTVNDVTQQLTVASGATALYVADFGDAGYLMTPIEIDWNGTDFSLTPVYTSETNQNLRVYRLLNPDSGTHNLFVDWTGSSGYKLVAFSVIGGDAGGTHDGDSDTDTSASATSASITVASETDNLVVAVFNINGPPAAISTGDTEELEADVDSTAAYIATAPGGTSVTVDASWSGGARYDAVGWEVNAAGGGKAPAIFEFAVG